MGLLKFIIVGAAVGYGVNYITKKNENGRSIADDVIEKVPEWFEKASKFAGETFNEVKQTIRTTV